MAVIHGDDQRRGPKRAVAGGKNLGIGRAHGLFRRVDLRSRHEFLFIKFFTGRVLADRGNGEPATNLVLRIRHESGHAPFVADIFRDGLHAGQDQVLALLPAANGLHVVLEINALLDRALQLVAPRGNLVGAAAIENLHILATGEAFRDPARIHGDIPAADDDHP